jgi:hypothetical protein
MRTILDKIPYSILIVAAILMLLAPFKPMPHVLEIHFLEVMAQDENIRVIVMYLESVKDARKLLQIAKAANQKKPVILGIRDSSFV